MRDADVIDRTLVKLLTGRAASLSQLASTLVCDEAIVNNKLLSLIDAGLVRVEPSTTHQLTGEDAERFNRQLPYLAEYGAAHDLQRKLRSSHVVVLGAGGLGTWAIGALASVGVGRLTIVDGDVVELSNLNRQILYTRADVGRPKAGQAAAWVNRFDPEIRADAVHQAVAGDEDVYSHIQGCDVLVHVADQPIGQIDEWVGKASLRSGVPYLSASQMPPLIRIGPMFIPGVTGCYHCVQRTLRQRYPLHEEVVSMRQASAGRPATTLGPASGIVGTILAQETLHLLIGQEPATAGCSFSVDLRTLEVRAEAAERILGCGTCDDQA